MDQLEQATQALQTDVANAQQSNASQQAPQQTERAPEQQGMTAEEIIDLEKVQKVRFDGKELTPEQLRKERMMHGDYTKKTQALSEQTKYWRALEFDLDAVSKNPSLASQFYKMYPKEFHKFLKMAGVDGAQEQSQTDSQPRATDKGLDPELLQRLDRMEGYIREKEVEKHEAVLDSKFSRLSQKYPEAMEDVVLAQAQVLLDKNADDRGYEISDEVWDRLWKQSHDSMVKRDRERQSKVLTTQREANQKGKAQGPGGGVPGSAPQRVRLKDVAELAVKDLTSKR